MHELCTYKEGVVVLSYKTSAKELTFYVQTMSRSNTKKNAQMSSVLNMSDMSVAERKIAQAKVP